jgi:hypothetical protein
MKCERHIERLRRTDHAQKCSHGECERQAAFTGGHGRGIIGLAHANSLWRDRQVQQPHSFVSDLIEINTVKGPRAGERSRLESMVAFFARYQALG